MIAREYKIRDNQVEIFDDECRKGEERAQILHNCSLILAAAERDEENSEEIE